MHFQPAAFAEESGQRKTEGREARRLLEEEVPRLARGKSPAQPAEEVKSAPTDKCEPKLTEAQSRRLQQPLVGRTHGAMRAAAAPLVSGVGDTSDAWQKHMVGLGRDSAVRGAQMKSAPADIQPGHEVHGDKWSQAVMHLFRSAPLRGAGSEASASGSGSDLKKFRPVPRRSSLEHKPSLATGMQLVPAASTSDEARRAQEYLTSTREGWLSKADVSSTKPVSVAPAPLRTEVAPERRIAEPSVAPKESPPPVPQPRAPVALTPSTPAQSGERFVRSGRQWKVQGGDSQASHDAATKVQGFWRKKRDARQQAMTQQTWREVMARPAVQQRARSMPQALPQEVAQTLEEIAPAAAAPEPVIPVEAHLVSTAEASRSLCASVYQAARRTISALDVDDDARALVEPQAELGREMDEAPKTVARQEPAQVATPELQPTAQEATPPVQPREAATSEIKAADAKAPGQEEVPVPLPPLASAEPPMPVDNNAKGKRLVEEGGTADTAAQDEQRVQLVQHTIAIKDGNSPLVAKDSHNDDADSIGISTPTSELHDDISILASDDEDESAPTWGVVHWIPQPQESTLTAAQVDLHELARGNQEVVANAPSPAVEAAHFSPRPPKGRAPPPEGVVARKPAGPKPVRKLPAGLEARLAALAHPVPAVAAQEIAAANAVLWDGSRSPRVPAEEDWSARGHQRWRPKDLPSMVVPEPMTKHVAYMELQPHTWAQAVPGLAKGKRQKQQEAALPSIALPRRYDLAKTGKIARLHAVVAPPRRDMIGAA